ncbi:MAG: gluconokinase [Chloroflexi bacterium]|nr:gluconokinase [Chloroflexota bacterium]
MVFDEHARAVKGLDAQVKYKVRTTPDGGNELDADAMLRHTERVIDEVLAQAGRRAKQIVAVASDSLVSNVLGVDADGRAVTPVFTYADTRNAREVATLRAQFDQAANHQRVGTLFHSSYLPARFLWLAQQRAEEFKRARYWMSLGEYFLWRWTGERACSYSVASWTGLLNRRALTWDKELVSQLPITPDQLSPLVDYDTRVGKLRGRSAERWAALRDAAFLPTLGDGATVNIGSGCVNASRIALTMGTTSAMRVTKPCEGSQPSQGLVTIPPGLWAYRVTREHELVGGALSEGGALFSWMRATLKLRRAEIETQLAAMEPDAHGLTMLPFLAGERAPNWNADARGAIAGLRLNTQPIDILRAGLEAMAYRLGLIFGLLHGAAPHAREVIASGGALMNSPTLVQIIADVLNAPVIASAETEATSRGDAVLALKALGIINSFDDAPATLGATIEPDAARHAIYARAMERQSELYDAVVRK